MNFLLEYRLDDTNFIAIYNDQGLFTCQTKDSPNDILESDNIIVTFGKNFIEFFSYSQIIDNNNINNNKIVILFLIEILVAIIKKIIIGIKKLFKKIR